MPKLSIIMPVYNEEKRLDRAVASVVAQTFQDWELILVNDGSLDSSAELCEAWTERDERISVIHQGNIGPGPARNAGMKKARGDFAGFVDADDYIMPEMYQLMLDTADEQGADLVKCGMKAIQEQEEAPLTPEDIEQAAETQGTRRFATGPVDKVALIKKLSTGSRDTSVCNLIIQKSLYKATQFSSGFYEDAFYLVDLLSKAKLVYAIPQVLYVWIHREDELSFGSSEHKEVDRAFYYQRLFRVCDKQEEDMEKEKKTLFNTAFAISERIKTDELRIFSRDLPRKMDILSKFLDKNRDYLDPDIMEIYDLTHEIGDDITEV